MKAFKYCIGLLSLLVFTISCKKMVFDDVSFVQTGSAPANLSAFFDITQDNTGLVTITPSGEGAVAYDVTFGDGSTTAATVVAGKSVQHIYKEGVYNVKFVGHSVTGKTFEITKQLTVSFRAPENLKVKVDINGLTVSVSASADYETLFKVYWGDANNLVPIPFTSFNEGQTVTHTYGAIGNYTIKVVALSGGAATTEYSTTVKVAKQIDLPVTFDDPAVDYTVSDFGNNSSSIVADPTNAANKVMKTVKPAGAEVWAGTTIGTGLGFATPIPLSNSNSRMSARVYSPAAGLTVKLKIENHSNGNVSVESDVKTTVANAWETLTWDFKNQSPGTPAVNYSSVYDKASVFFDFGNGGTGKIFYFDDLKMAPPSLKQIDLPVTFDDPTIDYTVTDFGNNQTVDATDPTNAGNKVKKTTKPNGAEVWAGTTIGKPSGFATKIPLSNSSSKMSVRIYSPAAGLLIKLKVEDHNDPTKSVETDATTTVANAWETLVFDFKNQSAGTAAFNAGYNYDKASIFFDFGNPGNGKIFYWDDVKMVAAVATVSLPLDFESSTLAYSFTDFGGGNVTVINNPQKSGINTSNKVAKMVKNAGEVYGGSFITLDNPINFSLGKTLKVKVYSPRVGAKLLLKVENLTNGGISYEKEVTTTTANAWEELTFDFSGINTANSYQKVVLIFDLGTMGDGTANFTYLFDDIRQL